MNLLPGDFLTIGKANSAACHNHHTSTKVVWQDLNLLALEKLEGLSQYIALSWVLNIWKQGSRYYAPGLNQSAWLTQRNYQKADPACHWTVTTCLKLSRRSFVFQILHCCLTEASIPLCLPQQRHHTGYYCHQLEWNKRINSCTTINIRTS